MKLYYVPRTRATRPRWLLEELGVPYQLVRLDTSKKENKQPEYLAIHPLGHVPALVDQDVNLIESAAICMYLADKFPEKKLAPPLGTKERAQYYQWILFAMTTVESPLVTIAMHTRFLPEEKRNPAMLAEAQGRLKEVLGVLENRMQGKQYVVGDHFTAADVVLASNLIWGNGMGQLQGFPTLEDYIKRMMERPAQKKATAD
jgi:glutathione S-transferase